jgi:hypothetical protein
VEVKSFDELCEADERTLSFSPLGLGGKLTPQSVACFQQEVVSHPELAAGVPKRVCDCFDRLLMTHAYGVLCYEFFTIAHDQAQLALEFALWERFVEFHGDTVEFRDEAGNPHYVATTPFRNLQAEVRRHGSRHGVVPERDRLPDRSDIRHARLVQPCLFCRIGEQEGTIR